MITIFAEELLPKIKDYDVILFGMGINGSFNQGLLYELDLNFPSIRRLENLDSPYGDKRKLGKIFAVECYPEGWDKEIVFCACYMNNGGYKKGEGGDYVMYDCLESSIEEAKKQFNGKKIAAPVIGANYYDGAGDKEKILNIFRKVFTDVDIDLYDYEQKDFKTENFRQFNQANSDYKNGIITKEEYELKKRQLSWQKLHGIFKKMPEDFQYDGRKDLIRVKKEDLEKN